MMLSHKFLNYPRLLFSLLLLFSFNSFISADEVSTSAAAIIEEVGEEGLADQIADELSDIQPYEDEPIKEMSYWKEFFRMMMILGVILGFVLLLAWFLRGFLNKRVKQVNESNIIKVIERRNLSQKSMLYLVQVHERQFLIGDSAAGGVEYLKECTPEIQENAEIQVFENKSAKTSFMEILQRKLTDKHSNLFKLKK